MVTVLKEKGIFAGVNLFSKQDTMDITDMFKIPLFKNFTLKMREEFLDKLEYTVEEHPKGKTIIHMAFPYGEVCDSEPYSLVKIPSSKRFVKAMTCGGVPTGLTQNVFQSAPL